MLSDDDKRRIEEEELYRAEVRRRIGPVETTSFVDRTVKFIVKAILWWYVLAVFAAVAVALVMTLWPGKL